MECGFETEKKRKRKKRNCVSL